MQMGLQIEAINKYWEICQVDIKNTYLYRDLDKEIHIDALKGMDIPKGIVLCLHKAPYSLKQARHALYQTFNPL